MSTNSVTTLPSEKLKNPFTFWLNLVQLDYKSSPGVTVVVCECDMNWISHHTAVFCEGSQVESLSMGQIECLK